MEEERRLVCSADRLQDQHGIRFAVGAKTQSSKSNRQPYIDTELQYLFKLIQRCTLKQQLHYSSKGNTFTVHCFQFIKGSQTVIYGMDKCKPCVVRTHA